MKKVFFGILLAMAGLVSILAVPLQILVMQFAPTMQTASAAVMLLTIALTNVYTLVIAIGGKVYMGEWFVGYLGFALQSLSFLALDLFVTCFAKNQMTGAAVAFGANFLLWMADMLADNLAVNWLSKALQFVSLYDRYEPFRLGQLSYSGVLFFISFAACCLVAAVRVLDARRFSEGGAA